MSTQILDFIGTITIPATTEQFVARDKFRRDSKEVKFCGFYGSFVQDFLADEGKIEESLGKQKLHYRKLLKQARSLLAEEGGIAIIPELGGEAKAEITLTELWSLLKKHAQGEESGLRITGYANLFYSNIFYVRNTFGVLRAVYVGWCGNKGAWRVHANFVERSFFYAGDRVFSRSPR